MNQGRYSSTEITQQEKKWPEYFSCQTVVGRIAAVSAAASVSLAAADNCYFPHNWLASFSWDHSHHVRAFTVCATQISWRSVHEKRALATASFKT